MAPSSASTKKAAKLAQKGQGRKVRFQGGTFFPMIVAVVLVLGLALVFYARQSRPAADASEPQIDDHWHIAYGFFLCDQWVRLTGDAEEQDATGFFNTDFARTGIHSHDDGLMHWHPFSSAAVGRRAQLEVFLDVYDVELSNDKLEFPDSQASILPAGFEDGVFEEGETTCTIDGAEQDAELKAVVWENFTDTDDGTTFIADFDNIRISEDAMVISIAFVPDDTTVGMPPWAPELPDLGAVDTGQLTPDDLFGGDTIPADTAPADTTDSGADESGS